MKSRMIALAVAASFAAAGAQAAINDWDWETSTGFVDFDDAGIPAAVRPGSNELLDPIANAAITTGLVPLPNPVYETLEWGVAASGGPEQSSVVVTNLDTDTGAQQLETQFGGGLGGWETINEFTHNNVTLNLNSSNSPWNAVILGGFEITGPAALVSPAGVAGSPLQIQLTETPDVAGCPQGNPLGTVCDDIFLIANLSGSLEFYNDGEYIYTAEFRFDPDNVGLNVIPLPGDAGYQIFTAEPGSTTISTQARVVARKIPAPGVLALLGVGIIGLGLGGRKRRA